MTGFAPTKEPKFTEITPGSVIEIADTTGGIAPFKGTVIEVKPSFGPTGIPALIVKVDGSSGDPVAVTASGRYKVKVLVDSRILGSAEPPAGVVRARKLPVEISAIQFLGGVDAAVKIIQWAGGKALMRWVGGDAASPEALVISTLEGEMRAEVGDWVLEGAHGEFYPVKPNIFADTYEILP